MSRKPRDSRNGAGAQGPGYTREDASRHSYGSRTADEIEQTEGSGVNYEPFSDVYLRPNQRSGWTKTTYNYTLPDGVTIINQQNRYDDQNRIEKKYLPSWQFHDQWLKGPGPRTIIYNWPAIIAAGPGATVYVVEGEKNADDCTARGVLATTVISHIWSDEAIHALAGYNCNIIEDNDDNGRKNAAAAYRALSPVAKSTRIITAQHLWKSLGTTPKTGDDVTNWFEQGGKPETLLSICNEIPAAGVINCSSYVVPDEATLPLYDRLYGDHLIRGFVSCTAAFGGTGKSSLGIGESLAQVTGKALMKIKPPRPSRVLLINLEDDRATMDKRIVAAMKHYGISAVELGNRFFTMAKGEIALRVAKQSRFDGVLIDDVTVRGLLQFVKDNEIDIVSVDPFISTHRVSEIDPGAIRDVLEAFDSIAQEGNCAVHIWHHTRKVGTGEVTVESTRGTVAFIDACRSVRVLETMHEKEAETLQITSYGRYFRSFDGKRNLSPPPSDRGDWYKIASVTLNNNGMLFGDDMGVVTAWEHPSSIPIRMSPANVAAIRTALGDRQWSKDARANAWMGYPIANALKLDPESCALPIKRLIKRLINFMGILEPESVIVKGKTINLYKLHKDAKDDDIETAIKQATTDGDENDDEDNASDNNFAKGNGHAPTAD